MTQEKFRKRLREIVAELRADPKFAEKKAAFDQLFSPTYTFSYLPADHPAMQPQTQNEGSN